VNAAAELDLHALCVCIVEQSIALPHAHCDRTYTVLNPTCHCRHPDRGQVAGILEVIQTSEDMVFSELVEILSQVLEQCSLYTCDQLQRDRMRKTQPATVAVSASTSRGDNSTHMSASQNGSSHDSPKSIRNIAAGRESASPEVSLVARLSFLSVVILMHCLLPV